MTDAMDGDAGRWHASADATAGRARGREPVPYAVAFRQAPFEVGYYVPAHVDGQGPHDRDELYIVVRGSGAFVRGGERVRFGPGDVLHVPAGMDHRFEDFGDELETWVVFVGPPAARPGTGD